MKTKTQVKTVELNKPANGLRVIEKEKAKPEQVKPETIDITHQEVKIKRPTLEDRMNRIKEMERKAEKLNTLKDTQRNLMEFNIGSHKMEDRLTMRDGEGFEFKTSNSEIIQKVHDLLTLEVGAKIKIVEAEILEATL